MEVFTWSRVQTANSEPDSEDLYKVSFGSGVTQRGSKSGLPPRMKYSVDFQGTHAEIEAVETFLFNNWGKLFLWTVPTTTKQIRVHCGDWSKDLQSVTGKLSMKFQQEYL